jgi:hypothetical protein
MNKLIRCADDRLAPWCCICVHLNDGTSNEWCPVLTGDDASEVEYDWLCPACLAQWPDVNVDDLLAVCIHCARRLRERSAGPNTNRLTRS